jgi:hypothetical protein
MSISFSRRNLLFASSSRSLVFILDFFHSLFRLGRGGDVGGVDPWADTSASLWDRSFLLDTGTSLCTLGQRRLPPTSARGLHSHSLGGFTGGEQRWRVLTCTPWCGGSSNSGRASNRSIRRAATPGMETP